MLRDEKLESLCQAIRLMEVCGLFGLIASSVRGERVLHPDIKNLLAEHEKSLFMLFERAANACAVFGDLSPLAFLSACSPEEKARVALGEISDVDLVQAVGVFARLLVGHPAVVH